MNDEQAVLNNLDSVIKLSNNTYHPRLFDGICGPNAFSCVQAFFSIADALPKCADRLIESSFFKEDGLQLQGNKPEYKKMMTPYLPLLTNGYKNLLWLAGA